MPSAIATPPPYVLMPDAKVKKINANNKNVVLYYENDTFNVYGNNPNNLLRINKIQAANIPNISDAKAVSYDGEALLPNESFKATFSIENNLNGLYMTEIQIRDQNGKVTTFAYSLAHPFDFGSIDNIALFSEIGQNNYEIISASYSNRYNPVDSIAVSYSATPIPLVVDYLPGIKVKQGIADELNINYGVYDTNSEIIFSYQVEGTTS